MRNPPTFLFLLFFVLFVFSQPQQLLPLNATLAYVHIAKTAGTSIAHMSASMYMGVYGNKGTSPNVQRNPVKLGPSAITRDPNARLINLEIQMELWGLMNDTFPNLFAVIPCREPFDHVLALCNFGHHRKKFPPPSNFSAESLYQLCNGYYGRFDSTYLHNGSRPIFKREFCLSMPMEVERTIKNLGKLLPKNPNYHRRRGASFYNSDPLPRDKNYEAQYEFLREDYNRLAVEKGWGHGYYEFCSRCENFNDFVEQREGKTESR